MGQVDTALPGTHYKLAWFSAHSLFVIRMNATFINSAHILILRKLRNKSLMKNWRSAGQQVDCTDVWYP